MKSLTFIALIGLLVALANTEELKFFLMPVSCWNNLLSGKVTLDCIVKTGVQGINILNMTVVFYYRLPQIMKLLKNKNTIGISPSSIFMEILSFLCIIGYYYTNNYSFWNYGELYANCAQLIFIYFLVYKYKGVSKAQFLGSIALIFGFFASIMLRVYPTYLVAAFMTISTALYLSSKFVQIKAIHNTHFSKNLSLITLMISPAGIFSRLLTTVATLWHDKFLIVA